MLILRKDLHTDDNARTLRDEPDLEAQASVLLAEAVVAGAAEADSGRGIRRRVVEVAAAAPVVCAALSTAASALDSLW